MNLLFFCNKHMRASPLLGVSACSVLTHKATGSRIVLCGEDHSVKGTSDDWLPTFVRQSRSLVHLFLETSYRADPRVFAFDPISNLGRLRCRLGTCYERHDALYRAACTAPFDGRLRFYAGDFRMVGWIQYVLELLEKSKDRAVLKACKQLLESVVHTDKPWSVYDEQVCREFSHLCASVPKTVSATLKDLWEHFPDIHRRFYLVVHHLPDSSRRAFQTRLARAVRAPHSIALTDLYSAGLMLSVLDQGPRDCVLVGFYGASHVRGIHDLLASTDAFTIVFRPTRIDPTRDALSQLLTRTRNVH